MKIVRWTTTTGTTHVVVGNKYYGRFTTGRYGHVTLAHLESGIQRSFSAGDRVRLILLKDRGVGVNRWLTAPLVSVAVYDELPLDAAPQEELVAHWALNCEDAFLDAHPSTRMEG